MNFVQFFINTLLHFDFLKISLYDGVFPHSQLIILLKKYDGLGLFCSGYVCRAQNVYGPQNVDFWENWFLMLATLLHFDFLKISLYDGVFSHSQLTILLKKYDGLGLFCSG